MKFEKRVLADGRATLYCGDSLQLLRAGVFGKIGAIVSDPPYGIGYQHSGGGAGARVATTYAPQNLGAIHGDDSPFDPQPWVDAAPVSRERGAIGQYPIILLWGADHFRRSLPDGGTLLAWDKHLGRGPDDTFADCEWAWSGRKRECLNFCVRGAETCPRRRASLATNAKPRWSSRFRSYARLEVKRSA